MKLNKINDVLSNNRVMANEIIKTSDSIEDLFSKCGLGVGWSYPNLRNIRQFYIVYAKRLNSGYPFDVKNANQWLAN